MIIDNKKLLPAFLLATLGFILAAWSIYIILSSNSYSFSDLKSPIVFIIAGILLIVFAVWHVKGKEYSDIEYDEGEDLGIEWDESKEGDVESEEDVEDDDVESEGDDIENVEFENNTK
ncbi:hypothetical protein MmiAt1_11100 [Methanimicrococcus sp. At1]|uniref:Uncharacterized protein n=1 Tax=Methanimicrococcus hacksteinii TaxID=3028293 RepID=A0ABU3VQ35_9EURY|nr:hypothetical protein [Methanimicrococcus sp. At1]MDV0445527.1 hypothetical protein [Methanimicrococcus sp. At1]